MTNIISKITNAIKNWWIFLITGILLILASIWIFRTPLESYVGLAWLFSILVLANGISYTFFSISNREELEGWGWYLSSGIFGILIGMILILYPEISIVLLPFIVGFWLMFSGISVISTSLDLKKYYIMDWGWLMLFGILITILAFFMVLNPFFGAFNIVYITSLALLVYGISHIMLAFKLKKVKSKTFGAVDHLKKNLKNKAEDLKVDILQYIKNHPADDVKKAIGKKFAEYKAEIEADGKQLR